MSALKRLASQTVIYGLSSMLGRFLNYLLVPLYTYIFTSYEYGVVSEFYAYSGFFAVLLVMGFETGYFRFRQEAGVESEVFSTSLLFICLVNLLFFLLIALFIQPVSSTLYYSDHHEYFYWFAAILALDSIGAIPFAQLRARNKALRFASIKLIEIGVNVLLNLFFIVVCKQAYEQQTGSFWGSLYNPQMGVGYIFISNLIASAVKLLLLLPQFEGISYGLSFFWLKKMLVYSLPMTIIGFAGIINEMLDRVILKFLLPFDQATNMEQLGIYGACYKLSILITLFIQAFRYAAEPFFFAQAKQSDSKKVYAEVMKYFVIVCCTIFLGVTLYIDIFKLFIGPEFRVGLPVVPILLMANVFLGVYVNLSIWYKLTDRTMTGAWVSIGGAVITILLNLLLVPTLGYMGSAIATLCCYVLMVLISYTLGQRYFPVPYDLFSFAKYLFLAVFLFGAYSYFTSSTAFRIPHYVLSTILMTGFLLIVWLQDLKPLLHGKRY